MNYFQKMMSRVSSSARGEVFNPLIYPFLLTTFAYGIGFLFFANTADVGESSLYRSMTEVNPDAPQVWGALCIITILVGFTFLLFNIPPAGKLSGLAGFMLWTFASICWLETNVILVLIAIGIPNMFFWCWQYLSLSLFRREDATDKQTMVDYDAGGYDSDRHSKRRRETNRGVDEQ